MVFSKKIAPKSPQVFITFSHIPVIRIHECYIMAALPCSAVPS